MINKKLKEICSDIVDCPHSTPKWTNSGIIVLRNQYIKNGKLNLSEPSFTDEKNYLERTKRAVPQYKDIVITREAPMGEVCMIPNGLKCCLGQRMVLLRSNPAVCDPDYLLYALQSKNVREQISWNEGTGSVVSNLRIPVLEDLNIPYTSLDSQREISKKLKLIDDKIEINNQINETLEAMAKAIFKEWFIDFGPVKAKAQGKQPFGMDAATAALFPDSFEDSELGPIPKGWKVKTIAELTSSVRYGYTASASVNPIGPKFLRITDIQGGKCNWESVPFCEILDKDIQKYKLSDGDIVVARTGASTGENMLLVDPPVALFASYLVCFKFNLPAVSRFVATFMRTKDYFDFIKNIIGGSAQPNANAQQLASAQLIVPSLDLIESFFKIIQSPEKMIRLNQEENNFLVKTRDLLLPKLISGEIELNG